MLYLTAVEARAKLDSGLSLVLGIRHQMVLEFTHLPCHNDLIMSGPNCQAWQKTNASKSTSRFQIRRRKSHSYRPQFVVTHSRQGTRKGNILSSQKHADAEKSRPDAIRGLAEAGRRRGGRKPWLILKSVNIQAHPMGGWSSWPSNSSRGSLVGNN